MDNLEPTRDSTDPVLLLGKPKNRITAWVLTIVLTAILGFLVWGLVSSLTQLSREDIHGIIRLVGICFCIFGAGVVSFIFARDLFRILVIGMTVLALLFWLIYWCIEQLMASNFTWIAGTLFFIVFIPIYIFIEGLVIYMLNRNRKVFTVTENGIEIVTPSRKTFLEWAEINDVELSSENNDHTFWDIRLTDKEDRSFTIHLGHFDNKGCDLLAVLLEKLPHLFARKRTFLSADAAKGTEIYLTGQHLDIVTSDTLLLQQRIPLESVDSYVILPVRHPGHPTETLKIYYRDQGQPLSLEFPYNQPAISQIIAAMQTATPAVSRLDNDLISRMTSLSNWNERLCVLTIAGFVGTLVFSSLWSWLIWMDYQKDRAHRSGWSTQARIVAKEAEDTIRFNYRTSSGKQAEDTLHLSPESFNKVKPGQKLTIRINPDYQWIITLETYKRPKSTVWGSLLNLAVIIVSSLLMIGCLLVRIPVKREMQVLASKL